VHIERVIANAFGPFLDRSLDFSPGMNVVYGPNESGKSTWHAALYAGLCGMRRGAGQPGFDRDFTERHRPWDDDTVWQVGTVIGLTDGRRVELSHDLANRIDSTARDADLAGRDYSDEILFDGAPDGSRWLGLNRKSFLSTACIRQTQMLRLFEDEGAARAFQEDLQRAASTAGDTTATRAISLLDRFQADRVGSDRAPTKPLRLTAAEVETATHALTVAHEAHQDYLERRAGVDHLEREVADLRTREGAMRAVLAEMQAAQASDHLKNVRLLADRFPDGPPHRPGDDEYLSNQVATALQKWQARPSPVPPIGASVPELEEELAGLDSRMTEISDEESHPVPRTRPRPLLVVGLLAAAVGSASIAIDQPLVGVGLLAVALGLFIGWLLSGSTPSPSTDLTAEMATVSLRRDHVEHLIHDRLSAEQMHAETVAVLQRAIDQLREAATAIGFEPVEDPEDLAEALFSWQKDRKKRHDQLTAVQAEWDTFQQLIGRETIEELELAADRLDSEAIAAIAGCDPQLLAELRGTGVTNEDLAKLGDRAQRTRDELNTLHGELRQFAGSLPSVPEAEEALDVARQRFDRVRDLAAVLQKTMSFLRTAEEEVNRNLAPVLKSTVEEWLGQVTNGRYTECKVDPESLKVEVRGPGIDWRRAELLSHGTREQVYLLLRLALARHLTRPDEVCPLILDDVLTSYDEERREVVLDTLFALSGQTQVILFSHDREVAEWARIHLDGESDSLILLDRLAS